MTSDLFEKVLFLLLGIACAGILISILAWNEKPPTCEQSRTELWAYGQCLKFRPSCEVNTEGFVRMYELKKFIAEQCPDNSGDDYQSQSSE